MASGTSGEVAPQGIAAAAKSARVGADHTATITKAKAGPATYISESNLAGHNDPGAEAVARLFAQFVQGQDKRTGCRIKPGDCEPVCEMVRKLCPPQQPHGGCCG